MPHKTHVTTNISLKLHPATWKLPLMRRTQLYGVNVSEHIQNFTLQLANNNEDALEPRKPREGAYRLYINKIQQHLIRG